MRSDLLVFVHGEPIGRAVEGRERACWFTYLEVSALREADPSTLQ